MTKFYRGCFVTGTDTGVGKTTIAAALSLCLKQRGFCIGVMKPIETGLAAEDCKKSDAEYLRSAVGCVDPLEIVNPYRFSAPLAPVAAASHAGSAIDIERIVAALEALAAKHEYVVVEGVGGVMVPLTPQFQVRDLIARLRLPAVVVGRTSLGGINHALLTVEALNRRGIVTLAIALNQSVSLPSTDQMQIDSTVGLVRELSGVPVLGPVRYENMLGDGWAVGLAQMAQDPAILDLADRVIGSVP
jgi:dethiobiotin synthetase